MSEGVYIKTFGTYGVAPAKIWVNKETNRAIEWKKIDRKMKNGETYIEQYGLFKLSVSLYDGKDKDGKTKYKSANLIYVKVKDINLYNLFSQMENNNVSYYNFYGSIVVFNYHTSTTIAKDKDGDEVKYKNGEPIKNISLTTEWCYLEDPNFKLVPVFKNGNQNIEQNDNTIPTNNIANEEISDEEEIPF